MPPLKVGVLASGSGTNVQSILDSAGSDYEVAVVVSDRDDAFALERARKAGVPAAVVDRKRFGSREDFDDAIRKVLESHGAELVCLAGFMRILSPPFVRSFENRILNIHPALLPAFPGASGVREALDYGVRVTGTTVHFVDEEVDHGPIILQEAIVVDDGDSEESLHERIKEAERRLYPEAIRLFAAGRLKLEGRRCRIV
jgi:phosphoribosylglycinamide formyltransferase 1